MIKLALLPLLLASFASAAPAADPVDCGFWPWNDARYVTFFALARKSQLELQDRLSALNQSRARAHEEAYTDLVGEVMAGRLSQDELASAVPASPKLQALDADIAKTRERLSGNDAGMSRLGTVLNGFRYQTEPFMALPANRNWLMLMAAESRTRVPVEFDAPADGEDPVKAAERVFTEQYLAAGLAKEDFQVSCRPRFSPERP